jgi:hypothetical protein
VTLTADITALEVSFQSQESLRLGVVPTYERLERDFEVSDGIVLPAGGEYEFVRFRVNAGTANRRVVSVNGAVELGDFFSGTREEYVANLSLRPRPGVRIDLQNEWNVVDLPEGSFDTNLHRLVVDTQFSPWIYLVNNVQYDNVSSLLGWQFRLRWIVTPGNDLYLVYTQNWLDDPIDDRFSTQDRQASAKFIYTYRW